MSGIFNLASRKELATGPMFTGALPRRGVAPKPIEAAPFPAAVPFFTPVPQASAAPSVLPTPSIAMTMAQTHNVPVPQGVPIVPPRHSSVACSSNFQNLAARLTITASGADRMTEPDAQMAYNTVLAALQNCKEEREKAGAYDDGHKDAIGMISNTIAFLENLASFIPSGGPYPGLTFTYLGNVRGGGEKTMRIVLNISFDGFTTFYATEEGWWSVGPRVVGGLRKRTYRKRKHVRKTRTKKISRYGKQ